MVGPLISLFHHLLMRSWRSYPFNIRLHRSTRTSTGVGIKTLVFPVIAKASRNSRSLYPFSVLMEPRSKSCRVTTCTQPAPPPLPSHPSINFAGIPPSPTFVLSKVHKQKYHPEGFVYLVLPLVNQSRLHWIKQSTFRVCTLFTYLSLPYHFHVFDTTHTFNYLFHETHPPRILFNTWQSPTAIMKEFQSSFEPLAIPPVPCSHSTPPIIQPIHSLICSITSSVTPKLLCRL